MADWDINTDPYQILELDTSSLPTDSEIKKVYGRKAVPFRGIILIACCAASAIVPGIDSVSVQAYRTLALKKHPDKNPNDLQRR